MPETERHKQNPLVDLLVSIVIPSVILMKFSGAQDLGAFHALILALAFPLGWGAVDLLRCRRINFIAVLGLVSIVLTGGIGLLALDTQWLAVKEAAIPGLIGIAVVVSTRTRYPLVKTLLYSPATLDVARVREQLEARGVVQAFEAHLQNATYMLGGTFFFSAAMNYFLTTWIVVSPTGSAAFNEELGRLTLLSYPVIALPSMLMTMFVLYYLARGIHEMTGLKFTDLLHSTMTKS